MDLSGGRKAFIGDNEVGDVREAEMIRRKDAE